MGDKVLKEAGFLLARECRSQDFISRSSDHSDESVVELDGVARQEAIAAAGERSRVPIERHSWHLVQHSQ